MRRQNPPQAHLDKAQGIEKYLRPLSLAAIYGISGSAYCLLILLIYAGLLYASVLNPTPVITTLFVVAAIVPAIVLFLVWFLRPNDPISAHYSKRANMWRTPITLVPEPCTFTIMLYDGELIGMKLVFYYPSKDHMMAIKDRLYTSVHTAIANDFSGHTIAPTAREIERLIEPALETLALEYSILVLYGEVLEIVSDRSEVMASLQYLKTGTW